VCCSVLQCVDVYCSALPCALVAAVFVAVYYSVDACCSALPCAFGCMLVGCGVLRCVAVCCGVL